MRTFAKKHILVLVLAFLPFLPGALKAQEIKIRQISLKEFPVISCVVSIETTWGAPILVDPRNLRLTEDGQPIRDIKIIPQDSGGYPSYTVIVIDKSGSMRGEAIEQARLGALEFVKGMKDRDQGALVVFDTEVEVVSDFTSDRALLESKIRGIRTGTDTAIIDALWAAVELMKNAPAEAVRIALLMTDGKENRSKRDLEVALETSRTLGMSVYTIGLGGDIDPRMLKDIAQKTEANYYHAPEPKDLVDIYNRISQLLHAQLRVVFRTPFEMDDRWHVLRFVVPHMGKDIAGERSYLSALESRIPTELLKKIRDDEIRVKDEERIRDLIRRQEEESKARDQRLITILAAAAGGLFLVLIIALVVKKRRS